MKFQKFSRALTVGGLALAMVSFATNLQARPGTAEVKSVSGTANYSVNGGPMLPLKVNSVLKTGATIQTVGNDSRVYLSLNDGAAAVEVTPNTVMKIDKLLLVGGADGDTETQLKLQTGSILGSIKKLSKASHYDIKTPNGVAGIRGTDFTVTVAQMPNGTFQVTFTSVEGELVVAAIIQDGSVTAVLGSGDSWTTGDGTPTVTPIAQDLLDRYKAEIIALWQDIVRQQQPLTGPPGQNFKPEFVIPVPEPSSDTGNDRKGK